MLLLLLLEGLVSELEEPSRSPLLAVEWYFNFTTPYVLFITAMIMNHAFSSFSLASAQIYDIYIFICILPSSSGISQTHNVTNSQLSG